MFQDRVINNYIFNTRNVLGKGYSATVYVGTDSNTSKKVAIKVIKKEFIDKNEKLKLALDNEVIIMKQMNSKNIVKLLDTFESQNNYYLILEYCEQGDLRQYLRKNGVLPEAQAKDLLIQILKGFQDLIKSGIIHRDLKPANILISNTIFKLADFGFSKILKNQSQMLNSYVGTPVYMSPQILTEAYYSQKCDIWSLGIIYYECLFGCYPWNMKNTRLIDEILNNREIVFPKYTQVSKLSQEFIGQCLQFAECDRINWNRVFSHPLFQNRIKDIQNQDTNSQYFITQLKDLVLKQGWTTNMLFSLMAINNNHINVPSLHKFLQTLNQNLTFSDTIEIFKRIDVNNRNMIILTEFKVWFDKIFPSNEINPFKQQLRSSLTKLQKSEQTIKNLNQKIQQLQIDPIQLFQKFDKENTMTLDKNGIRELSLSIDPSLQENELETIYLYFDLNKNQGKICGWEFKELFKDDTELDENQIIQLQPSLSGPGEKLSKL